MYCTNFSLLAVHMVILCFLFFFFVNSQKKIIFYQTHQEFMEIRLVVNSVENSDISSDNSLPCLFHLGFLVIW